MAVHEPVLCIKDAEFVGNGLSDEGITYEGYRLADGSVHFYDVSNGQELTEE